MEVKRESWALTKFVIAFAPLASEGAAVERHGGGAEMASRSSAAEGDGTSVL